VIEAVGPRLRALRRHRGVTLADLSATTGISESTLSRLESGRRRANLQLLLPLARAYGAPLDDLVGAPRTGDPRVHLKSIVRHGLTFIPLTRRAGGIQAFTSLPHALGSADGKPVELLILFGQQGERAHVRARST
jgi:transcriptional regulator with XRE-family HTH domain